MAKRNRPRPTAEERFWAKVDRRGPDDCWPWLATIDRGYGSFDKRAAHRFAYELLIGPIPKSMQIDHLCHNVDAACPGGPTCLHRRCQNPKHLEATTNRINSLRGKSFAAQQARRTHCPKGHPYDQANTVTWKGRRSCRTCHRELVRRRWRAERGDAFKAAMKDRMHCPKGHPYDEANTYRSCGRRSCKECLREKRRRRYWKQKAERNR